MDGHAQEISVRVALIALDRVKVISPAVGAVGTGADDELIGPRSVAAGDGVEGVIGRGGGQTHGCERRRGLVMQRAGAVLNTRGEGKGRDVGGGDGSTRQGARVKGSGNGGGDADGESEENGGELELHRENGRSVGRMGRWMAVCLKRRGRYSDHLYRDKDTRLSEDQERPVMIVALGVTRIR